MNTSGIDYIDFYKPYEILNTTFKIKNGWLESAFIDYEIVNETDQYIEYKIPKDENDIIYKIEQLYNFSSYYPYLELDNIRTPKSIICSMKSTNVEEIFNSIKIYFAVF